MAKLVAKTYGDALFSLAQEDDKLDALYEEVLVLKAALEENNDLLKIMDHPKISKEDKIKLAEDMLKDQVSKELCGFVILLVTNGRFNDIEDVFEYFIHQVKEHKRIGVAYVETAVELTDEQKQQIVKKLLDTTDYESFEMVYAVDRTLIGGMVIRIKDRVVDSSIRAKLEDVRNNLMKVQVS